MAENKGNAKTNKTYEDTNGARHQLDANDPTVADRVTRGELREVTDNQATDRR